MPNESEPNGTRSQANPAQTGVRSTGALSTSRDIDFYSLTIASGGILGLMFDAPTSSSLDYFFLSVFDASGNRMARLAVGSDKAFQIGLTAGAYTVSVEAGTYYNGGTYSILPTFAAGATTGFESESNDTVASADPLAFATPIKGQMATRTDLDFYKITATGAGALSLVFDAPGSSSLDYFQLGLYSSTGVQLGLFSTGSDKTFQTAVQAGGDYYIGVGAGTYYDSNQYNLTANFTAGGNNLEQEPNDDYANALLAGRQIRGQLATAADVDWFYLDVAAPGDLQINFDAPTNSSLDYFKVWVLDAQGNVIAGRSTGVDVAFSAGAPTAGAYFVAVTTENDGYFSSGQYGLSVTPVASSLNREREVNDTLSAADALALGTPIVGQLSASSDVDTFAVKMTSAGVLTVNFDGPTSSTWSDYFQLQVLGPTGSLVTSRNTGVDTVFEVKVAAAGTYFVQLRTANSSAYNGGDYRLLASAVLAEPIPSGAITGTALGDRLVGTAADDLVYGLGGSDLINGGAGNDTVVFRAANENLSITTIGGLTAVRGDYAAGEHALSVSRLWNVEKLKTWSGELTLVTNAVVPLLGTAQTDRLVGTPGDDLMDGLGGPDFIDGGVGNDTLALFSAADAFEVMTVAGITRVKGKANAAEYAGHTMKVVGVESFAFAKNQTLAVPVVGASRLFGSVGSDLLRGTTTDDVIDGQGGSDTVDGGAGSDTLVFFGRYSDFTVKFPTTDSAEAVVTGKANTDYAGQTVRASNVEFLAFADSPSVAVTNPPKVVLTPGSTLVAEGAGPVSLGVSLSVAPSASVTVNLAGGSQLSPSVTSLTFSPTNWNLVQTANIQAVDDAVFERQHTGTVTLTVSSTDSLYLPVSATTLTYTISDNDGANLGAAAGTLWNDADRDGTIDPGESTLAGWRVFDDVNRNGRWDTAESSTVTDTAGRYRLDDLTPGAHTIVARVETGWSPTYPSISNSSASIIVNAPGSGEGSTGEVFSTELSAAAASALYANLGTATNIATFHADPRFASIKGQGVTVVVIDTGIDLDHPSFGPDSDRNGVADRIIYSYDFVGSNDANASDVQGHGTHVAGIVGSSDAAYSGIAPGVNIVALRVLGDDGRGSSSDILEAINWVVANAARYNIAAVNLSLGNSTFDQVPAAGYASTQFKALANAGVIVVSASGNAYGERSVQGVSYPSSDAYSLSVGAVWGYAGNLPSQSGTVDAIAYFSQRDDSESDIFVPGVSITSAQNGGTYVAMSGTSMAAPEISGMVALAQQLAVQELGRRLSFDEIRSLLKSTGKAIVDGDDENDAVPNTGLTFYRADMLALAEAIVSMKPQVSHSVVITSGGLVDGKNFGFSTGAATQGLAADDFIVGSELGEIIRGGAGDDQINGGGGDDIIHGEAGNDLMTPGTGDDAVDGGEGSDKVVYLGDRSSYAVSFDSVAATYTVSSTAEGRDLVSNTEFFSFGNVVFSAQSLIDATGPTAMAFTPLDDAKGVAVNADLAIQFSETIQRGTGSIVLKSAAGETIATYDAATSTQISVSGRTLTLNPAKDLGIYSGYKIDIAPGAVKDLAGNSFAGLSDYNFRTETLDGLYHVFAVVFAAAPGGAYMGQMAEAYNQGLSLDQLVEVFTTKPQFTDRYPSGLSHRELAVTLVDSVVKNSATGPAKQAAMNEIASALDGGLSRGQVLSTAFGNLINKPLDDVIWGATAKQFQNELAVARYYTEVLEQNSTDPATLRKVIASVDQNTDVSTPQKIVELIGVALGMPVG